MLTWHEFFLEHLKMRKGLWTVFGCQVGVGFVFRVACHYQTARHEGEEMDGVAAAEDVVPM